MTDRGLRFFATALVVGAVLVAAPRASATLRFGPMQISGNLQSQNIIRHPDADTFQFVQQRNVARVQFTYDWLQAGRFMDRLNVPFIRESKLFLLYRGVYDSIYDLTPTFEPRHEIHQNSFGGLNIREFIRANPKSANPFNPPRNALRLSGLSDTARDSLKYENVLREAYIDMRLRDVPLQIRLGRQQIVWGEADNNRLLDRPNSLDLTWHFQQEIPAPAFGWDEIRRPFWMVKFLYEIGNVWKFSQSFIEWYWNLGDWEPAKQAFLPRPWGLPFMNPLTNPVDGVFFDGVCGTGPTETRKGFTQGRCNRLLKGTELFGRGDWQRNPIDNGQWGVRYHGIAPFGLEFTLNYFYQRFAGDDATNYAPLRGLPLNARNSRRAARLINRGVFPAEAFNPYVHTIGMSANYSDEEYTQTVFRMEALYDMGVPFFDVAKETVIDRPSLPGITEKDMFKIMLGFDRPTWIRWLNKKSTVFLTGQWFLHQVRDHKGCNAPRIANGPSSRKRGKECLVGGLDLPSTRRLGTQAAKDAGSPAYRDKLREFESMATFAAFTFFRGGSVVPTLGLAIDLVNQFNMEPFWAVDYVARDWLVINLSQRYFVTPRGSSEPVFETWGLGGLNAGRSETMLRVTLQY